MNPTKGFRFLHSRVIDPDLEGKQPQLFEVTKVASGMAFYRPVYRGRKEGAEWLGSLQYCPISEFSKWCKHTNPED